MPKARPKDPATPPTHRALYAMVPTDLKRRVDVEAAQRGIQKNDLVVEILQTYFEVQHGARKLEDSRRVE